MKICIDYIDDEGYQITMIDHTGIVVFVGNVGDWKNAFTGETVEDAHYLDNLIENYDTP